jgi:hypothetical protein
VTGVGEGALSEGEDLVRLDTEDDGRPPVLREMEGAVTSLEDPLTVPLGPPQVGEAAELIVIGDPDGITLDDDIEPRFPTAPL